MSLIPYTKRQLVQRIRKHMANGYANDAFATSTNEIMLYIDQSLASQIVGLAYANAKIEGALAMPEAFLVTYQLSVTQDSVSKYWTATLPQPPVSLPLGYSINRVYFASTANGQSRECLPIKAKRVGYRILLPMPKGVRYWVENSIIWLAASDGSMLLNLPLYVQMASSRTDNLDTPMNVADDVIEAIFNAVVKILTQRYQEPKDIVHDDLPAGNTNLKS